MADGQVVVLGGYGATGLAVTRLLLQYTNRDVIIAGRRMERAEDAAALMRREFPDGRIGSAQADAQDSEALEELLYGAALVIVCSSTPEHAATVARAAINSGCNYLDIHAEEIAWQELGALAGDIAASGRHCISQAGMHPGLPPVLVRYVAPYLETLREAVVAGVIRIRDVTCEAMRSLLAFMQESPSRLYHDGDWHAASGFHARRVDYGAPLGELAAYPSYSPDMRELPTRFGIPKAGVYFAGFNWFVDWLVLTPLFLFKLGRFPWALDLLTRLACWGLRRFSRGPALTVLKAEVTGESHGKMRRAGVRLSHADPYVATAAAVVACALQLLDDSLGDPGLYRMGDVVGPERLLSDLRIMGIGIQTELPRL